MSALEELGREITLSAKQGFVLKSLKEVMLAGGSTALLKE